MAIDVAQHESSSIKCYASVFSNMQIWGYRQVPLGTFYHPLSFFSNHQKKKSILWKMNNYECRTVCLIDPPNDQLVKDEGAQIFYSIRSQTKPIGIRVNCEDPSQSLPYNAAPTIRAYDRALISLVGPCALPIHPTTNW